MITGNKKIFQRECNRINLHADIISLYKNVKLTKPVYNFPHFNFITTQYEIGKINGQLFQLQYTAEP